MLTDCGIRIPRSHSERAGGRSKHRVMVSSPPAEPRCRPSCCSSTCSPPPPLVANAEGSEAWLGKQGHRPDEEIDPEGDDAQALLQQASLLGQAALGPWAGRRARRVQSVGGRQVDLSPRCAAFEGIVVHLGQFLA